MTNKEFLFIFDAALSNPNGDPDQENKPRMDRATKTNLVSDTRLKRNIRDYLIKKFDANSENDVFVRMMGENKVSVDKRLMIVMGDIVLNQEKFLSLVEKNMDLKTALEDLKKQTEIPEKTKTDQKTKSKPFDGDFFELYNKFFDKEGFQEAPFKAPKGQKSKADFFDVDTISLVNNELLTAIIRDKMIDIRYFGSAVAVKGFSRTFTGPIQVSFGYSLHPVELCDSNTIVTLMSGTTEGESNIGKKEKLKYSLIGFTGTINEKRGTIVGLKEKGKEQEKDDLELFRESIILSLLNNDSDSKKNQFPRLYLEIDYKENEIYGRLGDLRTLIKVAHNFKDIPKEDFSKVVSLNQLSIDFTDLISGIEKIKEDRIQAIRIWTSLDGVFDELNKTLKNKFGESFIEKLEI